MTEQQYSALLWHIRIGIVLLAFQSGVLLAFFQSATLRFPSPLIEPDVPDYGIGLNWGSGQFRKCLSFHLVSSFPLRGNCAKFRP